MTTVKELRELAKAKGLTGFSKLKKTELEKLLNNVSSAKSAKSSVASVANELVEIMDYEKYNKNGVIYTKVWEQKSSNMYAAVLVNGKSVIVIKGHMTKGLGRGVGKWIFDEACNL
jgi:hypothetical protein